jgi:rod shape determining protein RodA
LVIAAEAPTLFSRLLAGSMAMIFFTYAFVNMGMVSGILPVVGVPLPFISYGGSNLAVSMALIGILINIHRQGRREPKRRSRVVPATSLAVRF